MTQTIVLKVYDKEERKGKRRIKQLLKDGYTIQSNVYVEGKRSAAKTIGLGLVFLPLALLGKNKGYMQYVLTKPETINE